MLLYQFGGVCLVAGVNDGSTRCSCGLCLSARHSWGKKHTGTGDMMSAQAVSC
jgi:hypothetical protein